jgi:hypothetical protein
MGLATIDFIATTQTLCENLQNLGVFVAMYNGDINKIHGEFDKNHSQLLAHGATVEILLGSCLMPILLSHATTSRSTSPATMTTGLMGNLLE